MFACTYLFLILLCLKARVGASIAEGEDAAALSINLLHMNDIHSHFDQVNVNTGRCHTDQAEAGNCFGGMARMFTAIRELQAREPSKTLTLNAGDYFQGTMWFNELGYEPIVTFSNMLNWTAMALGNHDFDLGSIDLADFSKQVNYDLLATNLIEDESVVDRIQFYPSKVVEIEGHKIGLIGYITDLTPSITSGDIPNLTFQDEVESVQREARRLKSLDPPVEILIALGHAGYQDVDLRLAAEVEELDFVVGGHSHSFLFTGNPAPEMVEEVEGDYPTYVTQPSTGRVVPVVQVYKYSKYLGDLRLNFDSAGELLTPVAGVGVSRADVLLIDDAFPQDPWIEAQLEEYRELLSDYYPPVGWSEVLLETRRDNTESNLGNVITDSMAEFNIWGDINIAFINDGGIRATVVPGEITGEDLIAVLPFGNTIDRVTMYGRSIRGILEEYAGQLCANASCGPPTFLQFSGLKVEYDIWADTTLPRVTSLLSRCPSDPSLWCELEPDTLYPVALPSFLANGGSRTMNFPDWIEGREEGGNDFQALVDFVVAHSPITTGQEGRITIRYHP